MSPDGQKIHNLLDQLSEASLFELLTLLNKQQRRAALRAKSGDVGDLAALNFLRSAAQVAHDAKLCEVC